MKKDYLFFNSLKLWESVQIFMLEHFVIAKLKIFGHSRSEII